MSTEDLEQYEAEIELQLYKEYKDVAPMFRYVVETERRFYLANEVEPHRAQRRRAHLRRARAARCLGLGHVPHRPASSPSVSIVTFKDVNIEELPKKEL